LIGGPANPEIEKRQYGNKGDGRGLWQDCNTRLRPLKQALGHTVRLIPPAYVPYVKRQKNDAADAEAMFAKGSPEPTCGSCKRANTAAHNAHFSILFSSTNSKLHLPLALIASILAAAGISPVGAR
jgi:hypothetical protein